MNTHLPLQRRSGQHRPNSWRWACIPFLKRVASLPAAMPPSSAAVPRRDQLGGLRVAEEAGGQTEDENAGDEFGDDDGGFDGAEAPSVWARVDGLTFLQHS